MHSRIGFAAPAEPRWSTVVQVVGVMHAVRRRPFSLDVILVGRTAKCILDQFPSTGRGYHAVLQVVDICKWRRIPTRIKEFHAFELATSCAVSCWILLHV